MTDAMMKRLEALEAVVADQHILTGGLESWQARHIAACIRALKETRP